MRVTVFLVGIFCLHAFAQNPPAKSPPANEEKGMPPRATPHDYQAQGQAGKVTIGAEFMGHSVPKPEGPLATEDFVVVEIGLFGAPDTKINLTGDDFTLRVNGKKAALPSQPFGMVAATLKDPEWAPPEEKKEAKSKTSLGGGGQADNNGPPPPVHVPIELQRAMAQYVQKAALAEGDRALPQAGLIFFQYRGKTKSIHSLELIYTGAAGNATLKLQP
jgi:hypothetical protein